MDIRMPEMDGLEATRRITTATELSQTRVLVLTTFELDEYVFGALDAGASGFLLKGGEPADLLHAIRTVANGEALLAPTVTRRLINAYVSRPQPPAKTDHDGLDELTTRARSPERCPQPALPSSVRALSYSDTVNSERVHGTGGGPTRSSALPRGRLEPSLRSLCRARAVV
jgi:CheY-like chemotaxis protein